MLEYLPHILRSLAFYFVYDAKGEVSFNFSPQINIGPPAPLQTESSRFCKMKCFLEKEIQHKNEEMRKSFHDLKSRAIFVIGFGISTVLIHSALMSPADAPRYVTIN